MLKDFMVCLGEPHIRATNLPNISVVGQIDYEKNFSSLEEVNTIETIFFCSQYLYIVTFLVYDMPDNSQNKLAKLLSRYIDSDNGITKKDYVGSVIKMKQILSNVNKK